MTSLKTSDSLLHALKEATARGLTHEQIIKQRLSFIMGALPEDNHMTRDEVQEVLARDEGKSIPS